MSVRRVGDMAEAVLQSWASEQGLVANRVENDLSGWDYLIEFPVEQAPPPPSGIPLDMMPPTLECRIQVKASDEEPGYWDIKLDNAMRFANSPLPCFFLFFEYGSQSQPQRAYLVHVDDSLVLQVLKRLRNINTDTPDLRKKTIRVRYNSEHELQPATAVTLQSAMLDSVGSFRDYAARKLSVLRSGGFDEFPVKVSFTVQSEGDFHEHLVDMALGLGGELQALETSFSNVRFGVQSNKVPVGAPGTLSVRSLEPVGRASVVWRSHDHSNAVAFEADVYTPGSVMAVVPPDYLKVRLSAPSIDIVVWPSRNLVNLTPQLTNWEDPVRLREVITAARLVLLHAQAAHDSKSLRFDVWFSETNRFSGTHPGHLMSDSVVILSQAIESMWRIAHLYGLELGAAIHPRQIVEHHQHINLLRALLDPWSSLGELTCSSNNPLPPGARVGIPHISTLNLGLMQLVTGILIEAVSTSTVPDGEDIHRVTFDIVDTHLLLARSLGDREPLEQTQIEAAESVHRLCEERQLALQKFNLGSLHTTVE